MIVGFYKADHIRAAILKRGLTLREVAKRAGMEPPQLSRILNADGDLHVSTLDKLAEAIPCDPGEFFGDKSRGVQEKEVVVAFPRTQAERDKLAGSERPEHFIPVPLLADAASLGHGNIIEDAKTEGYCLIYKDWLGKGRHYAIRVKGESMMPTNVLERRLRSTPSILRTVPSIVANVLERRLRSTPSYISNPARHHAGRGDRMSGPGRPAHVC